MIDKNIDLEDLFMKEINNNFLKRICDILEESRNKVKTAINISMVYTYYEIGKIIIEEEQKRF